MLLCRPILFVELTLILDAEADWLLFEDDGGTDQFAIDQDANIITIRYYCECSF